MTRFKSLFIRITTTVVPRKRLMTSFILVGLQITSGKRGMRHKWRWTNSWRNSRYCCRTRSSTRGEPSKKVRCVWPTDIESHSLLQMVIGIRRSGEIGRITNYIITRSWMCFAVLFRSNAPIDENVRRRAGGRRQTPSPRASASCSPYRKKLLLMIIALGEFCRISGDNALRS